MGRIRPQGAMRRRTVDHWDKAASIDVDAAARRSISSLGRSITGVHMEGRTEIDLALDQQLSLRRERALAAIAKYRTPTGAAIIPVWFALFVALLIAFVPNSRPNPIPYVVAMLAFAVVWVTVSIIRNNRRLEAIVQLITQDDSQGVAKT